MSAQNAQGIQALLEAEKEASKIVAKARQCTFCIFYHVYFLLGFR
jgi:AhpD family alkylhydroperoxidase